MANLWVQVLAEMNKKEICKTINSHNFTPKKFFLALLQSQHPDIIDRLKKWPASGINTMELVKTIGGLLANNKSSKSFWEEMSSRK
ncbi:hypothetical protein VP01_3169g3 [Puccinia sorghi]|uniref:Uncharacterized protein n=1 Tax=Puccinia sorghi TaxID=27349 RepID=A0A0L6UYN7_9BASI|nr:hypothetical protein VP01_3169g3 [Puccinia sorghi]